MNALQLKQQTAEAALDYIRAGEILGVGTGSTVDCLIALLPQVRSRIRGVISSSERSTQQLLALGFSVIELNTVTDFPVYIDGADEIDHQLMMVKGGGAALTREKIVAAHAKQFVCIADASKYVTVLGVFPLPIEVIPMAAHYVIRALTNFGGVGTIRAGIITDNGNIIIDVTGLNIADPLKLEADINQITGVVTCGLFARRAADVLLLSSKDGIQTLTR